MHPGRSKDIIAPTCSNDIKYKIQIALEGGKETLILPVADWINFLEIAHSSIESMVKNMDWSKNNVQSNIIARIRFEPNHYLQTVKGIIASLSPDFLSEIIETVAMKIYMKGHTNNTEAVNLHIDCDFIDADGNIKGHGRSYIHFADQDEYYSFSFKTSADKKWISFSVCAYAALPEAP